MAVRLWGRFVDWPTSRATALCASLFAFSSIASFLRGCSIHIVRNPKSCFRSSRVYARTRALLRVGEPDAPCDRPPPPVCSLSVQICCLILSLIRVLLSLRCLAPLQCVRLRPCACMCVRTHLRGNAEVHLCVSPRVQPPIHFSCPEKLRSSVAFTAPSYLTKQASAPSPRTSSSAEVTFPLLLLCCTLTGVGVSLAH